MLTIQIASTGWEDLLGFHFTLEVDAEAATSCDNVAPALQFCKVSVQFAAYRFT